MPQLKFAPDMCIFMLASFFMTQEVLACFSDSEYFYHFLFMCLNCIGECFSVMEKILVMNIKTSMNSLCILRPIVLSILVQTSLYPSNIRAMLNNCLWVSCTFLPPHYHHLVYSNTVAIHIFYVSFYSYS